MQRHICNLFIKRPSKRDPLKRGPQKRGPQKKRPSKKGPSKKRPSKKGPSKRSLPLQLKASPMVGTPFVQVYLHGLFDQPLCHPFTQGHFRQHSLKCSNCIKLSLIFNWVGQTIFLTPNVCCFQHQEEGSRNGKSAGDFKNVLLSQACQVTSAFL